MAFQPRIQNISPDELRRLFESPETAKSGLTVSDAINLTNSIEQRKQNELKRQQMVKDAELKIAEAEAKRRDIESLGRAQTGKIQSSLGNVPAEQIQAPIQQGQELVAPEVQGPTTGQEISQDVEQQLSTELFPKESVEAGFDQQQTQQDFQNDVLLEQQKQINRLELEEKKQGAPDKDAAKAQKAKASLTGIVEELGQRYADLANRGEIVDTSAPTQQNILARAKSSGAGQFAASTIGGEAQSIRNSINSARPLLINMIRQASEMGARGIDSEKELEFYLQAATDTKLDVQSNFAALARLDKAYGLGEFKAPEGKAEELRNEFKNITPEQERRLDAGIWLRKNPNHPKAPAVRAKLGLGD